MSNDNRRIITNVRVTESAAFAAPPGLIPMEITFQDGSTTIRDLRRLPGTNFKYQGSFTDEVFILGIGVDPEEHDHEPVRRAVAARGSKERPLGLL